MDAGWAQFGAAVVAAFIAIWAAVYSRTQARQATRQAELAKVQAEQATIQAEQARIQAREAKRQADAAHGNVDPTFHIECVERMPGRWQFLLVAVNYNRHSIMLDRAIIRHDHRAILIAGREFHLPAEFAARMDIEEGEKTHQLVIGVPITGLAPGGSEPQRQLFAFTIFEPDRMSVEMQVGQAVMPEGERGRLELQYEAKFRVLDGVEDRQTFKGRTAFDR